MPNLDVSFMTFDRMLADTFTVTRRTDVVGSKGRTTPTTSKTFTGLWGVVTQSDPAELIRNDDGQLVPRVISIASTFAFRGAIKGSQPDLVNWNGTSYLIKNVAPYPRFGAGVYLASAESMTAMDVPQ